MRGDVGNSNFCAFIKNCNGLISWSFEIPHSAYSKRWAIFEDVTMTGEFRDQIDQLYGTYHDATIGFMALVGKVKSQNPKPDLHKSLLYGRGNPNDPSAKVLHSVKFSDLYKRNEQNGLNYWIIGKMLVVSIYNLWEDHYRPVFANQLGHKEKNELKSDLFWEIGVIRNAIIHNQGRKTKKFKRLKILTFLAGEWVQPTQEDIQRVIELIYLELTEIEKTLPNN